MNNLTLFLLAVILILIVAWLWPVKGADDEETLNSQDWRMMDLLDEQRKEHEEDTADKR